MTTQPPIGQRLRAWRLAKSWSIADVAAELSVPSVLVAVVERDSAGQASVINAIEALIAPPSEPSLTTEERQMVDRVVNAVRAGYVVSLIRPVKVDEGQIVLTFGDNE